LFRGRDRPGNLTQEEFEAEELEFKIRCEDFWKKREDPRRE